MKKIIYAILCSITIFFINCEREIVYEEPINSGLKKSYGTPLFNGWDETGSTGWWNWDTNLALIKGNLSDDDSNDDFGYIYVQPGLVDYGYLHIDVNNTPTDFSDDESYPGWQIDNLSYFTTHDAVADIAWLSKSGSSNIYIDFGPDYYALGGPFSRYDWSGYGYGCENNDDFMFCDMDGNGTDDIIKVDSDGKFRIDYFENGPGSWDNTYYGYGSATLNTFIAADLDGDGKGDLFKVGRDGKIWIDYASNGYGSWDLNKSGYGSEQYNFFCCEDFDGDGKADIGKLDTSGNFRIDFAINGFSSWDLSKSGYGSCSTRKVLCGDFDGDGKADILTWDANYIRIDYSSE
ncbi:MAG: FG-GAP repeat domain-containing protein [Bacteroidales bacterium]